MRVRMEKKLKTNEVIQRFHFTNITLHLAVIPRLKSIQRSRNDRKEGDRPLNHFSSHKKRNLKNPVSADWLLLFPLGCRVAEANWFRRDESGKTAALIH